MVSFIQQNFWMNEILVKKCGKKSWWKPEEIYRVHTLSEFFGCLNECENTTKPIEWNWLKQSDNTHYHDVRILACARTNTQPFESVWDGNFMSLRQAAHTRTHARIRVFNDLHIHTNTCARKPLRLFIGFLTFELKLSWQMLLIS